MRGEEGATHARQRHHLRHELYFRRRSTHESFDPQVVKREMRVIHDELQCTTVRIISGHPDRLDIAASHAADVGLEIWFSPFTNDLTTDGPLDMLADCAQLAERLRMQGAKVAFVCGAELTSFTKGFLPSDTLNERLGLLMEPQRLRELVAQVPAHMNAFFSTAVTLVRERFGGKITCASLRFEGVDWTPFDFVSFDAYRSKEVADRFRDDIRTLVARVTSKPVAITEFGCTTYRGAADLGGPGVMIVEWDGATPLRPIGDYVRDENEQAVYLRELLEIFTPQGVDTAFVCTFASYNLPHRSIPHEDFDMASYGVVKVYDDGRLGHTYPDMPWDPRAAFTALADYYRHAASERSHR